MWLRKEIIGEKFGVWFGLVRGWGEPNKLWVEGIRLAHWKRKLDLGEWKVVGWK